MGKKVSAGQRGSIRSWQLEWQGGGQLVTFNRLGKVLQTGSAFHLLCSTGWSLTVVLWVANTPSWSMDLAEVNEELSGLCIRKHSRLAGRARRLCPGPEEPGPRLLARTQLISLSLWSQPQHKLLIPSLFHSFQALLPCSYLLLSFVDRPRPEVQRGEQMVHSHEPSEGQAAGHRPFSEL